MFKRLVSNLPYSPALIGQVGFYAQRLRQEEATRRLGLVFTALALIVQSFAVFNPPEALASASPNNVIFEGVRSKEDLLRVYDANRDNNGNRDIQQIFTYYGITREDLTRTQPGTFNSKDFNNGIWSVGRNSYDAGRSSEQAHQIPDTDTTVYSRKISSFDSLPYTERNGSTYNALIGTRADGSWFAVMFDCGNLAYTEIPPPPPEPEAACQGLAVLSLTRTQYRFTARTNLQHGATANSYDFVVTNAEGKQIAERSIDTNADNISTEFEIPEDGDYRAQVTVQTSLGPQTGQNCVEPFTVSPEPRCPLNPSLTESSGECQPCPGDDSLWYKDESCNPDFVTSKTVSNETQDLEDASDATAQPGDRMIYTLTVENTGLSEGEYTVRDNLSDVMEYADVLDVDGGTVEKDGNGSTTGFVSWPTETLAAGEAVQKTVVVQVKDIIPATPRNEGNPESYNCTMTNSFGTSTHVMVDCPPAKQIERTVQQLPATGPGENVLFSGVLLAVVAYFYARSRQLKKEVRLLRREFASGSL